eukprot:4376715-Alexandrium_andersonii.AAC.1
MGATASADGATGASCPHARGHPELRCNSEASWPSDAAWTLHFVPGPLRGRLHWRLRPRPGSLPQPLPATPMM